MWHAARFVIVRQCLQQDADDQSADRWGRQDRDPRQSIQMGCQRFIGRAEGNVLDRSQEIPERDRGRGADDANSDRQSDQDELVVAKNLTGPFPNARRTSDVTPLGVERAPA